MHYHESLLLIVDVRPYVSEVGICVRIVSPCPSTRRFPLRRRFPRDCKWSRKMASIMTPVPRSNIWPRGGCIPDRSTDPRSMPGSIMQPYRIVCIHLASAIRFVSLINRCSRCIAICLQANRRKRNSVNSFTYLSAIVDSQCNLVPGAFPGALPSELNVAVGLGAYGGTLRILYPP